MRGTRDLARACAAGDACGTTGRSIASVALGFIAQARNACRQAQCPRVGGAARNRHGARRRKCAIYAFCAVPKPLLAAPGCAMCAAAIASALRAGAAASAMATAPEGFMQSTIALGIKMVVPRSFVVS